MNYICSIWLVVMFEWVVGGWRKQGIGEMEGDEVGEEEGIREV